MNKLISAQSPRIFENPLLERFSRAHPRMPVFVYAPVAAVFLWLALREAAAIPVIAQALGGYLLWTLTEYFGHRFIFHLVLPGALGARLHFLIHGVHHDFPNDPWRLVMPPLLSLPVLGIAAGVIWLIFGEAGFAGVMAGYLIGYILYDTLHYELHHAEQRSRAGRWLKRQHMMHHFRDPNQAFGISCPWWDYAFGTARREPPEKA